MQLLSGVDKGDSELGEPSHFSPETYGGALAGAEGWRPSFLAGTVKFLPAAGGLFGLLRKTGLVRSVAWCPGLA